MDAKNDCALLSVKVAGLFDENECENECPELICPNGENNNEQQTKNAGRIVAGDLREGERVGIKYLRVANVSQQGRS